MHKPSPSAAAIIAFLTIILLITQASAAEPVHRWIFSPTHVKERVLLPVNGDLKGSINGPFKASLEPESLSFVGTSKAGNEVILADNLSQANLPAKALTVEAWVMIDRPQKWGGICGAIQDNGSYEKGWLLGYGTTSFYFALSGEAPANMTYLNSEQNYLPGYWYHVVGTYDGEEQRIYIDGQLSATSRQQQGPIAYPPKGWFTLATYKDDNENYAMAGRLESISVWDEALDAEAVLRRYTERKARFPGIEPDTEADEPVAGWPTYMHDTHRSGITRESIKLPLHPRWSAHIAPPSPAWPPPARQDFWHKKETLKARVTYDLGIQLVSDGEAVYYGSSSEDQVVRLNARTGKREWTFYTEGPVRLAPVIAGDRLLFGCDDGWVYALDRKTGALQYQVRPPDSGPRRIPGNERIISVWPIRTSVLVEGQTGYFGAGIFPAHGAWHCSFNIETGTIIEAKSLDVSPQGYLEKRDGRLFTPTGRILSGAFLDQLKRRGKAADRKIQAIPEAFPHAFIGTPEYRFGGGNARIAALDAKSGAIVWESAVEGKVHSIILAGNTLFASTDQGMIYAFAHEAGDMTAHGRGELNTAPPLQVKATQLKQLMKRESGYTLFTSTDSELFWHFADHEAFKVITLAKPQEVQSEARRFDQRAVRVHTHATELPYTDHLFNLIVDNGTSGIAQDELLRVLHPDGVLLLKGEEIRKPPLTGIGEWTHLYGDAANTTSSGDQRVGSKLALQWFGRPGPQNIVDRHHRSFGSLWKDHRVFIPGDERVYGVDAYNGTILWEREVPGSRRVGVFRDNGGMVVTEDALFISRTNEVWALDPATGASRETWPLPEGTEGEWGYLAAQGAHLFGSTVKPGGIRREHSYAQIVEGTYFDDRPLVTSDRFFVLDAQSGKRIWDYPAHGGILNASITIGERYVYFVESLNRETANQGRATTTDLLNTSGAKLVALDIETGSLAWEETLAFPEQVQNMFTLFADDTLAMVFSRNEKTVHYDVRTFSGRSGKPLWTASQNNINRPNGDHGEQDHHPLLMQGKLIVEPVAYDLATGAHLPEYALKRPGHGCGSMSASADTLFFRAGNPMAYNLGDKRFTALTKVSRPGCWINMIPAGGLLLIPESSAGCTCNFAIQTSMALIP
ncbi:MAG: outer membrane protein assembly factor BamB, partial [Candidatus Omnitrophota bacterium]